MPRRLFRRYLPDPSDVRRYRTLRPLANFLHDPNLWAFNRQTVSVAVFVGLGCAFIPLPIQMFIAAAIAIFVRCNLPVAMGTVWISNPLTFAPIFILAYWVGSALLGVEAPEPEFNSQSIWGDITRVGPPLLLGCLVCGLSLGFLGWAITNIFWQITAARPWSGRREKTP